MNNPLKIGITHGDVNGISYEVILKLLSDHRILDFCTPIIYGSPKAMGYYKKMLNMETINIGIVSSARDASARRISLVPVKSTDEVKVETGKPTVDAGKAAFEALHQASEDVKAGIIDAIVTAPINKKMIQSDKFSFAGHTEYFANTFGGQALMLFVHDNIRLALVTAHLPLQDVSKALTQELIVSKLRILHNALLRDFGIRRPRIAVFGLNPHNSDDGLIGNEEQLVIAPAIAEATAEGIVCVGPLSADGFFGSNAIQHYDAVLAMYHDQGLAPFKALFMAECVNYTAGLSVVRTSPSHGTAYDIAGRNCASAQSIRSALYLACDVVRKRAQFTEMSANPLITTKQEIAGNDQE
ncbi:MAG: 4-hydroxythreonine-4-phosphate dehydrogenase PdxA [Prevotellaceae bacterium]|jgi:4-hydroxythreonine-4-phosphate dehydrogenase|nr:4-hydroxythreonine-4-phosphate dehydrogenase PdxA [Prevotellaceae bacterium]